MERNPFSAKNLTLRSYRVYILHTKWASSALECFGGFLCAESEDEHESYCNRAILIQTV